MVKEEAISDVLSRYTELYNIYEEDNITFFSLDNKKYGICFLSDKVEFCRPIVLIKKDDINNYPHVMQFEVPIDHDKNMYRFICLYESGSQINYLMSYEEKIIDSIDRLIRLVNLSKFEIEEEFQKEFLYYWNLQAHKDMLVQLYVEQKENFQSMNVYEKKKGNVGMLRLVSDGIRLNDKMEWSCVHKVSSFYIPIIDNRGILPPVKGQSWGVKEILEIIKGKDLARINMETYGKLKETKISTNRVYLVFEMMVQNNHINFCCLVKFDTAKSETILNKLESSVIDVQLIKSRRCDYFYLSEQIGNAGLTYDKKLAVVGVGSLGSYLIEELVKHGFKNITIYDNDDLEEANIMRHKSMISWSGINKARAMKVVLESIHPEININARSEHFNQEIFDRDMGKFDLVIFTIGSSDTQLMSNCLFKNTNYDKPVIYVWLEAGGEFSHILKIDYRKKGCFECLYTDCDGNLINNKANILSTNFVEEKKIRNGCGATRVAYGTEVLLRTTCVILDTIKKVFSNDYKENCLIDIEPYSVTNRGSKFIERKCRYCCDRDC